MLRVGTIRMMMTMTLIRREEEEEEEDVDWDDDGIEDMATNLQAGYR